MNELGFYQEALAIVIEEDYVSESFLQRKLKIGYAHANALIEALEKIGVISAIGKGGRRKVLPITNPTPLPPDIEARFDAFWELQFPNSHPAQYGVVKKFLAEELATARMIERKANIDTAFSVAEATVEFNLEKALARAKEEAMRGILHKVDAAFGEAKEIFDTSLISNDGTPEAIRRTRYSEGYIDGLGEAMQLIDAFPLLTSPEKTKEI